jgi:hypothetical protein
MADGHYQYPIRSQRLACEDFLHYRRKAGLAGGRTSTRPGSEAPMPSHLQPTRVTNDRVYRDERFRLVAPPAGLEPQVTADEALRLFSLRAEHARTGSAPPELVFALVIDATAELRYDRRPVWALLEHEVPVQFSGGPRLQQDAPGPRRTMLGDTVWLLDAGTGQELGGYVFGRRFADDPPRA